MRIVKNAVWVDIFRKYNSVFAEYYNQILLSQHQPQLSRNSNIFAIEKIVHKRMNEWFDKQRHEALDKRTLTEFLSSLNNVDDMYDILVHASYICDDGIPDRIIQIFDKYKDSIIDRIMSYMNNQSWDSSYNQDESISDEILAVAEFFKLCENWTFDHQYQLFISKYISTEKPYDIISDSIKSYIHNLPGDPKDEIVKVLHDMINEIKDLNSAGETLLISLVDIAAGKSNQKVFNCLVKCFENMHNKIIGVICFGDLQDKRAVPYLRSWLSLHKGSSLDPLLISELIASVKRLGNDTSDLEEMYGN